MRRRRRQRQRRLRLREGEVALVASPARRGDPRRPPADQGTERPAIGRATISGAVVWMKRKSNSISWNSGRQDQEEDSGDDQRRPRADPDRLPRVNAGRPRRDWSLIRTPIRAGRRAIRAPWLPVSPRVRRARSVGLVEWVALVLIVSLAVMPFGVVTGVGIRAPRSALIAARLSAPPDRRRRPRRAARARSGLVAAYGPGLAGESARGRRRSPTRRDRALPVDSAPSAPTLRRGRQAGEVDAKRDRRTGDDVRARDRLPPGRDVIGPATTARGGAPASSLLHTPPLLPGSQSLRSSATSPATPAMTPTTGGDLPAADRRRRCDVARQLPSQLQPPRRRRQLGLRCGLGNPRRLGPGERPLRVAGGCTPATSKRP